VAKSGRELEQLLAALPATLELTERGQRGTVTMGLIRRRANTTKAFHQPRG
jgi:hypothetical protein